MSDTPRTDAKSSTNTQRYGVTMGQFVEADFARQLERELNEAKEQLKVAQVPLCVGEPIISILAEHGVFTSIDGRSIVAADGLFKKNPYDDRDQWRTMAQQLAEFFYQTKTGNQAAHAVFERFNELNAGGTPAPTHQTLATALKRYATHRETCSWHLTYVCTCGLASLLKQLE